MPRFFDEFVRASPDPTLIISVEGTIIALNGAARVRLQTTRSRVQGMALETMLNAQSGMVHDVIERALLSDHPIRVCLHVAHSEPPTDVIHAEAWRMDGARGTHVGIRWRADGEQKENLAELTETIDRLNREMRARVKAEHLLNARNTELELTQLVADIGSWRTRTGEDRLVLSASACRILGLDASLAPNALNTYRHWVAPSDAERVHDALEALYDRGESMDIECGARVKESFRIVRLYGRAEFDDQGNRIGSIGFVQDLTAFRSMKDRLDENLRLRRFTELILNTARDGVFGLDVEEKATFVNPAAAALLGWSQDDLIGRSMHQAIHHTRADASPYQAEDCPIHATLRRGEACLVDDEIFWRKDGSRFPVEYSTSPIIENDELRGAVVVFRDVSVRRAQAEALRLAAEEREAIRQRAEQERELLLAVTKGIVEADTYDIALETSMEKVCELTGWDFAEAWVPDDSPRGWRVLPYWYGNKERFAAFRELTEDVAAQGPMPLLTRVADSGIAEWYPDVTNLPKHWYRRASDAARVGLRATFAQPIVADGKTLSVLIFMLAQARERDDALVELVGAVATQLGSTFRETEYRQRLEQSEERFRLIAENVMDAFWMTDGAFDKNVYVSPAAEQIWGIPLPEIYREPGESYFDPIHEDDRQAQREALRDVIDRDLSLEYRIVRPDGEIRWLREKTRPIKDEIGNTRMIVGVTSDITTERNQQDRLRQVIERFNVAADAARIGVWDYDLEKDEMFWIGRMYTIYGIEEHQFLGDYETWKRMVHPEDREPVERNFQESIKTDVVFDSEYRILRPDGELKYIKSRSIVIRDERTDEPIRVVGSNMDISEQRELEARIAHAQKMETVGQLSGGMAHDFNNLLSVIQGGLQLLARRPQLRDDERATRWLNNSLDAVRRGAELSQRLLAFARRQRLETRIVDVAELVDGTKELLRRTLGESIALEVVSRDAPMYIETDVSQFENAILNLAVNARDAMPDGGRLTIDAGPTWLASEAEGRTHDIPPGEYIVVSVTDSGTGMTPEVQERAFEPFFTTKETGRGSGLGLSTIFGFCKQSGGHATICSEVGVGTTIRMYFPAKTLGTDGSTRQVAGGVESLHGGAELILAVDDDAATRITTVELLESFGYTVIAAEDGAQALQILRERPDIDLLFTDIVMPGGISGTRLAHQARLMRADIPVVFASGYSEEALQRDSGELLDAEWIAKPIDIDELARKIRKALSRE